MHIIYKTVNKLNGKFYIGKHSGNDPKYLGSGNAIKAAIRKYGRDSFERITLHEFETEKEALIKEKELVTKELVSSSNCYNLAVGGKGSECSSSKNYFYGKRLTGSLNGFYNCKHSKSSRQAMSQAKKTSQKGVNNTFYGESHSEISKLKMSISSSLGPIVFEGETFTSVRAARKSLGRSYYYVTRRLESPDFPNCYRL